MEAYRASDHARAMQPATAQTVLGRFDQATVTHKGVVSTFFRRDGNFVVRTDGPDGKPAEFEIAYTFGADPLQQYLIRFPDGRLQALGLAWDTRPRADGGQRWFHLYPGVTLRPPDPLHWTGREQTWNFQCAECHSTDLRKGYDVAANRYATTWAELTVSCEECHGPGSAHVAWAEGRPPGAARPPPGATGLVVRLGRGEGAWAIKDTERGIAEWTGPPRASMELDVCARCHARRRPIVDPHVYGRPFLDTHVPALLEPGLYHADGQVLGEVYEWGSFVQSRMQRAGVVCSDCHEPHRTALRAPGNAVCAQCHLPARFDTPAHHHHRVASDAARCVSCHMPARTHMVVDPRRDHSFRVPRPDLSVTLGDAERVHGLPPRSPAPVGRRPCRGVAGAGPPARASLRGSPGRRATRPSRGGPGAGGAGHGSEPARDRAGHGARAPVGLPAGVDGARGGERAPGSGRPRPHGRAPGGRGAPARAPRAAGGAPPPGSGPRGAARRRPRARRRDPARGADAATSSARWPSGSGRSRSTPTAPRPT